MAKPTQRDLAILRADYLQKREELLKGRVNKLGVKLFDRVYDSYLSALEQSNGKLVLNERNINMVQGLDSIYKTFTTLDNVPLIKGFITDIQKVVPLNERYFKNIAQRNINTTVEKATLVTNKRLGVLQDGTIVEGGFADKFINDKAVLKKIKKQTIKAVTKGMGFQDFKNQLRETIQGTDPKAFSGAVQQYYRNYAYDTYQKIDRINQDLFAKELGLRYFYWQGGLIKTSRPLCIKCNGKIVDSTQIKDIGYNDVNPKYRDGLTEDYNMLEDLGQHGCRHSKDYIADSVAMKYRNKWLDVDSLK